MAKVGIVVLNYKSAIETVECLKSLDRLRLPADYELRITVIDNHSEDKSIAVLSKLTTPAFKLVESQKNYGFAGGNNRGIKLALEEDCDWVLLLNNDTLVDRNLLINFAKGIEDGNQMGLVTPKIYFAPGYEFHKDRYPKSLQGRVIWSAGGKMDWRNCFGKNIGVDDLDRGQYEEEKEVDFATGACLFISKKTLKKVGYLNEKYFMYFEDVEYCQRVKEAGLKIVYFPKVVIWHKVARSSGIGSDLNDYYLTRNRLLFGLKYSPLRTKIALLKESIKFMLVGRKWQRIGVVDYYLQRWGKGSWK